MLCDFPLTLHYKLFVVRTRPFEHAFQLDTAAELQFDEPTALRSIYFGANDNVVVVVVNSETAGTAFEARSTFG